MARAGSVLALALLLSSAAADAQTPRKQPPAPARPPAATSAATKAQVERAAANFKILMGGLQSAQIPAVVKEVLFLCIYSNPFSKISESTDKALAAKKVDKNNPTNVIGAMAAICGLRPEMLKQQPQPPKK